MDLKANYIHKWLGLPCCLSDTVLFGNNILSLHLKSISLGYKKEKVKDSPDPSIQNTKTQVRTGHKWNAMQMVEQAIGRLKHREIVGLPQPGRAGFGWGFSFKMWFKGSKKERIDLVISEVVKMEEERYKIRAVSQSQQVN